MPRRDEYNCEFSERPFGFEVAALNELTQRGAKVKTIGAGGMTAGIRPNSIVLSINGERVLNYPLSSVMKKLEGATLPVRIRFGVPLQQPAPSITLDEGEVAESDSELAPMKKSPTHRSRSSSPRRHFRKYKSEQTLRRNSRTGSLFDDDTSIKKVAASPRRGNRSASETPSPAPWQPDETQKFCSVCAKDFSIIRRRHHCRKCGMLVCGKCSRERRTAAGYKNPERVCDKCIEDEYTVVVQATPLGTRLSPSADGRHIVVRRVSPGSAGAEIGVEVGSYLIEINGENVEGRSYDDVLIQLQETETPFQLRFKRPNVQPSEVKEDTDEKEEKVQQLKPGKPVRPSRAASPDAAPNGNNPNLHVNVSSSRGPPKKAHRRKPSQRLVPSVKTPVAEDEGNETGPPPLEDNPGMEFIKQAEDHYENEDWWAAIDCYEKGIKLLETSLDEVQNLNQKRERKQQISEYRLQMMRAQRKAASAKRARKWAARQENAERGPSHKRSNTLQPQNSRNDRNSHRRSNTNDDGGGGGGGGGGGKDDQNKKQDDAFRRRLEGDIVDEAPDVSFKEVLGLESVKLALYESIILPALRPEIFTGLRAPATGLLLFGPPGNGKTMIAKCVAHECEATFFSVSASSITSKWVGEAERLMRTLFTMARERSPSIIFIDEIDSLLTARGGKSEAESSRRIKTEFLVQFDGVHSATDSEAQILVIGATNLPHQLDEAVLRRFSKRIQVPIPDEDTRYGIIRMLLSKQHAALTESEVRLVVRATQGYSCSDINLLCRDSAMGPVRDMGSRIDQIDVAELPPITYKHFQASLRSVRSSIAPSTLRAYKEWDDSFGSKMTLSVTALPESMRPHPLPPLDHF